MVYKGRGVGKEEFKKMYNKEEPIDPTKSTIIDRALTWCDVIYQAVVKAVDDTCVLIRRYPMDSYFNQIPLMVKVQSTIETEPVILDGVLYKTYPKIRREDIEKDTSNKFIDTMNLCNVYLKSICGDY